MSLVRKEGRCPSCTRLTTIVRITENTEVRDAAGNLLSYTLESWLCEPCAGEAYDGLHEAFVGRTPS